MDKTMKLRIIYGVIFLVALWMGITFLRRIMGGMDTRKAHSDSAHYEMMASLYKAAQRETGRIVFLGDDSTEPVDFREVLPSMSVLNRGIASDTTTGVLKRLDEVVSLKPTKLFILIGANDIGEGMTTKEIGENYRKIIAQIQEDTPSTRIYIQGLIPSRSRERPNAKVRELNRELQRIALEYNCAYLTLDPAFSDNGSLNWDYSLDGLHLTDAGVARWIDYLKPYIEESVEDELY